MKFKVNQEVKRTILWDDGERWHNGGAVTAIDGNTVTCKILVDQYRTMCFFADDGRATKILEGIKDEWIEPQEAQP